MSTASYSISKSIKLKKILDEYKKSEDKSKSLYNKISNHEHVNWDHYFNDENNDENYDFSNALYDLCESDKKLKKIVSNYAATRNDFDKLYSYLYVLCPVWSKDGNFVPISSFAFEITLEYLLTNKDNTKNMNISLLLDFFDI